MKYDLIIDSRTSKLVIVLLRDVLIIEHYKQKRNIDIKLNLLVLY